MSAGDLLVAYAGTENGSTTISSISGGSLVWTQQQIINQGYAWAYASVWTATVDGTKSMSVTFTPKGTGYYGGTVLTFRRSGGVGASAKVNATGAPALSFTTTQAGSAVVVFNVDWTALTGARAWRTNAGTVSEQSYYADGARYGIYGGYHPNAGPAATYTVGLSAPTGQTYSLIAIELKGSATDDTEPPSIPADLLATSSSSSQVSLSWTASTDNIGVAGYIVFRDGAQVTSVINATAYQDTGLAPSTTYSYAVAAFDSAGNTSGQTSPVSATTSAASANANLTVNGSITYQTMNGVGSNVNTWSWKNGELRPALDALVDTLGHNIFRVIHDRMEWAGIGNTRPATTLSNLQNLDPTTLVAVYEVSDMQDLWNTIEYLNSKGVTGDQIIVNFMGWTARWMGGSGAYGTASHITNDSQTNQDIATMIASLVYYGHHRRDVSGANANLSYSYIAPFNEPDLAGIEGPQIGAPQMNTISANIISTLNAMADTSTRLMGPDTATSPNVYTGTYAAAMLQRMPHFSWHSYSGAAVSPATARGSVQADWLTETSKWCSGCDSNQPPAESEWSFGSGTGDLLMGDIRNGFSAVLTWEAFDTYYYHHNSYSAWGHVGCTQNGAGCTTSDIYPRMYTVRGRAWPEAALAKAIRPGMVRRSLDTSLSNLSAAAFYDEATGRFSIVGRNTGNTDITINGRLDNMFTDAVLPMYETSSSTGLTYGGDVAVTAGTFTATIPANTFFYLSNLRDTGVDTEPPSVPTAVAATSVSASEIGLSWAASTDKFAIAGYKVFRNGNEISRVTSGTSYRDSGLLPSTAYSYTVAAYDPSGNESAQSTATTGTTQASGSAPVVVSFSAAPATLTAGQSSTLSWSVSGTPPVTLSVDSGVGTVTGASVTVSPAVTTIYTLTATNSVGSDSKSVTVVVVADASPPIISGVRIITKTGTTAKIGWTTNEPADSQVEYGLTTAYGNTTAVNSALVTTHTGALSGLTRRTTYHYRVKSRDAAGNLSVSVDYSFRTST